ncbi:MAG: ABC transporter ATP-binding protein [Gammaproteobacteria bacterium]
MAGVKLENVRKTYDHGVVALEDMNLEVRDGEFVVLVGPSGCGKSTALKMIAGLEEVSSGKVSIGGRDVTHAAPKNRDVAMVFQNYALYPHLTVRRNVGFPLRMQRLAKSEIDRRVENVAQALGIAHLLERRPRQLSGGQRQRVALGRAIVREPQAFLMDEPLSNLDARLRAQMRAEIGALHQRLGVTAVYVTHDQVEAMTMADRIVIMRNGVIQQVASPDHMYAHPVNIFVAGFIGSPPMNFFRSTLVRESEGFAIELGDRSLPLAIDAETGARYAGAPIVAGVRPECLVAHGEDRNSIELRVVLVESMGGERHVHVALPRENVATVSSAREGDNAQAPNMIARLVGAPPIQEDAPIRLRVDPGAIHIFDSATEAALN